MEVVAKIKEWEALYGEIPGANDWNSSNSRAAVWRSTARASYWIERVQRFESGEWPWTGTVHKLFGSWNNAIRKAGFEPRTGTLRKQVFEAGGTIEELQALIQTVAAASGTEARLILYQVAEKAMSLAEAMDEG